MKKRALILALAVLPVLVAVGVAVAAGGFDGAKSATARFHDLDQAIAAGYSVKVADLAGIECIAQPGEGAMGVHMLNPSLLDGTIDADEPELLVYEPRNDGTLKLVALEYLVLADAWARRGKALALRQGVRHDRGRKSLRAAEVLRLARVDLEAQPERDPPRLEPARRLLVTLGYAAAGACAPVAASCLPSRTESSNTVKS